MAEKKLSEELRHCLEGNGCAYCTCYEPKSVLTCRGLLQKAYEVVKRYEEMFPCKVGDELHLLLEKMTGGFDIVKSKLVKYSISEKCEIFSALYECKEIGNTIEFYRCDFGETVFLSKEAAEKALKEMEDRKNGEIN